MAGFPARLSSRALGARLEAIRTGSVVAGRARHEPAPGISAAVIRNSRLVYAGAVGMRVLDPKHPRGGPRLTPDSAMRVASISKLACAIGIMRLGEAGRLDLAAPIDDFLGFPLRLPADPAAPVTLAMLLSHTSGVRDGETYWGVLGETLADFFTPAGRHWEGGAHLAANQRPGAWFEYANLNTGVAASVAEAAMGARFDQLMRLTVFAPLGLACGFNWSGVPPHVMAEGAAVYRQGDDGAWLASVDAPGARRAGPVFSLDGASLDAYRPGQNGLLFSPQGGLRASARDLAVLGCLLIDGEANGRRLLSPETVDIMTRPAWRFDPAAPNGDTYGGAMHAYGLGVHILPGGDRGDGPIPGMASPMVGHLGEAYGLLGGVWVDRARKSGFVYLVTGGPANEQRAKGARSGFFLIEEELMTALYDAALPGVRHG